MVFHRRAYSPRAMDMVEENGSAVDPLSQGSSGDAAPPIATSVQSLRTHQQQTHHLVASTSIVQLTLPSSGTTQVYRSSSCVSMPEYLNFSFLFVFKHDNSFVSY